MEKGICEYCGCEADDLNNYHGDYICDECLNRAYDQSDYLSDTADEEWDWRREIEDMRF